MDATAWMAVTPGRRLLQRIEADLERASARAGRAVGELYQSRKFRTHEKGDHTPVTDADTIAERIIRRELDRKYPGVPVISEEDEILPDLRQLHEYFLVDPIDGTWNFASGIPVFFISIAYLREGQPRAAVMLNPVSRQLLSAVEGDGAYQIQARFGASGRVGAPPRKTRVKTPPYRPLSQSQVHRHDRRLNRELAVRILERIVLKARGVRDLGSTTAEMALIVSGQSDALVGYYVANWDVAAASLILKEAGGIVTRLDGSPIDFSGTEKFSVCAAGNPRLHLELLSALS